MSETKMMKSYVWLQTSDGSIQQVEQDIAMFCPFIRKEILQKGTGSSKNCATCLPQQVSSSMWSLILNYCRFRLAPGRSDKEQKAYDDNFVKIDTKMLCGLACAANSLRLQPVIDLTCQALARIIGKRSPEEIRDMFHVSDDLTEEEKLEPIINVTNDPSIRLLNRLYAKKKKQLLEGPQRIKKNVDVEEDQRSLDDLLSFINGDSKGIETIGKNKKKKKKGQHKKNVKVNVGHNNIKHQSSEVDKLCETSNLHDDSMVQFIDDDDDDDFDEDDGIDLALKAKMNREVEEFARRLNSSREERIKDFSSSSQERKLA
ncbi:putative S-phase kinase-associated protein [Medicago truncatula]|uniref:Putative S-phase kinase-associated protein n=1 Tax=Medicago truncatula TaxID=3880 RepID=G7IHZ3_MEDTR|nr:SKP1-like protein 20 [Medicago truncatula]AES67922.2 SCF ubiquitin ligase, SKP1 component [Medicago truncatula]RHN76339.1 putative S-phase kinase-associated protein [Medicago truncatula]